MKENIQSDSFYTSPPPPPPPPPKNECARSDGHCNVPAPRDAQGRIPVLSLLFLFVFLLQVDLYCCSSYYLLIIVMR